VIRAVLIAALVLVLTAPPAAARLRLVRVGHFSQPVYVTGRSGALVVVERYGRVRVARHGKVRTLLDLRHRVGIADPDVTVDQRGLFSIAFGRGDRLYIDYVDRHGELRVDEWRRRSRRLRHVLALGPATTQHHGGQLQFGPDGLLYVSTGMGDDPDSSQDPASPRGKLLRLDPRARPARPEVVARGLRNPWRFSFDRGRVLIGDVGENSYEEVDVLPRHVTPGVNFGWPAYEGFHPRAAQKPSGIRMPALVHRHGPGWCSIVGGYVARAGAPRVLHGRYVYGDLCSGRLWSARLQGTSLVDDRRLRVPPVFSPVSFGKDARGRLYVVSLGGDVFRLADSGGG
jgi:glucose/arabinose dehydrogenase